jgi:hypothetical protein
MQTETEAPTEAPTGAPPGALPALHIISDFGELDLKTPSEQGRPLHLRDPRNDKLMYCPDGSPATITFAGPDSDTVKLIHRRNQDATNENLVATNGKGADPRDVKDQRAIDDIASCARSWNLPPIGGKTLVFSSTAAKELLSDPRYKWIADQAFAFVYIRQRFFAEASSN